MTITADEFAQVFKELLQFFKDALPTQNDEALTNLIKTLETRLMKTIDELIKEVADLKTVQGSAIALLDGLHAQLEAAGTDPVKLSSILESIKVNRVELADAVLRNTPVTVAPVA